MINDDITRSTSPMSTLSIIIIIIIIERVLLKCR